MRRCGKYTDFGCQAEDIWPFFENSLKDVQKFDPKGGGSIKFYDNSSDESEFVSRPARLPGEPLMMSL